MSQVVQFPTAVTTKAAVQSNVPEFITPKSLLQMSDAEIDQLVSAIRLRRDTYTKQFKEARAKVKKASKETIEKRMETKAAQIVKRIDTLNKTLDALEKNIREYRSFGIQASIDV